MYGAGTFPFAILYQTTQQVKFKHLYKRVAQMYPSPSLKGSSCRGHHLLFPHGNTNEIIPVTTVTTDLVSPEQNVSGHPTQPMNVN